MQLREKLYSHEPLEDETSSTSLYWNYLCKGQSNRNGRCCPDAKCISVKALNKVKWKLSSLADALDYAIEMKPDLVSMSLGGPSPSPVLESRIKKLYEMNIPVICAAGNTGEGGVNWPAAFDETIAVAAYDKYGNVARFSSKGEKVEWAAPGVNIYSTFLNNGYASLSGTSMACPFIAGVVALMLSKHKKQEEATGMNDCKTVAEIREHLLKYTNDKGAVGRDNSWGYGVIDVEKLIKGGDTEEPVKDDPVKEKPKDEEPLWKNQRRRTKRRRTKRRRTTVEEPKRRRTTCGRTKRRRTMWKNQKTKNHLWKNQKTKNHRGRTKEQKENYFIYYSRSCSCCGNYCRSCTDDE